MTAIPPPRSDLGETWRSELRRAPPAGRDADADLLWLHQRERLLLSRLRAHCPDALSELDVLDVGCGVGGELLRLVAHGADPGRMHGVDLDEDRIRSARERLPAADLRVGDARRLPYATGAMDVVVQFTMLSSICDGSDRAAAAQEMTRVTRPGGVTISYDFWINPFNSHTRPVTRRELRRLFPQHRIEAHAVTLAPPLARAVCGRSFGAATALQSLPFLRTHVLAFITAPAPEAPAA
jgi:ubiquinone/menaquinone biosynthesis C-methylase UbiE